MCREAIIVLDPVNKSLIEKGMPLVDMIGTNNLAWGGMAQEKCMPFVDNFPQKTDWLWGEVSCIGN